MHRFVLSSALLACAWSGAVAAEFRAGLGGWRYDLSGSVTDAGRSYDFEDDLALQPSGRRSVLLEWDTGEGWWPDWSASFSQLGAAGYSEETFTLFVGGVPVGSQTESIAASADFDDYDLTARYPFDLGPFGAAVGLTAKRLRGEVLIDDSTRAAPSRQQYDETVPEVHLQLRWALGESLVLGAAGQGIRFGGDSALEWRATVEYRGLAPLLLEAGWQEKRYDLDLGDYALDARLGGALARVGFLLR